MYLATQVCGGKHTLRRMVSVIKSYCHNLPLYNQSGLPLFDTTPRGGTPQRQKNEKINSHSLSHGILWAAVQTVCRFCRHHRNLTSTTACWLISRSIIIGHFHLRTCPPRTGCTPAFPLGSLDAVFFTHFKMCRSVSAPRLRLLKWLMYLDCWIWLAHTDICLCALGSAAPGICQGS